MNNNHEPYLNLTVRLTTKDLAAFLNMKADALVTEAKAELDHVKAEGLRAEGVLQNDRSLSLHREDSRAMQELRSIIESISGRKMNVLDYATARATWIKFVADNLPPESTFELAPYELQDFLSGESGSNMIRASAKRLASAGERLSDSLR